jgi:hypothetical protein
MVQLDGGRQFSTGVVVPSTLKISLLTAACIFLIVEEVWEF